MQTRDVDIHVLGEKRNPGEGCRRRDLARGTARRIEIALDDGVQPAVEGIDALDGCLREFVRSNLPAVYQVRKPDGVKRDVFFRTHI